MPITYSADRTITVEQFVGVLQRTSLGVRRPLNDPTRITAMLAHADLLCTAWDGDILVGVARSVTDFVYCCYLSDLAVDENYQRHGIGRELLRLTQSRLHPAANLILLAAPAARDYYPHIGMARHDSAWIAPASQRL